MTELTPDDDIGITEVEVVPPTAVETITCCMVLARAIEPELVATCVVENPAADVVVRIGGVKTTS